MISVTLCKCKYMVENHWWLQLRYFLYRTSDNNVTDKTANIRSHSDWIIKKITFPVCEIWVSTSSFVGGLSLLEYQALSTGYRWLEWLHWLYFQGQEIIDELKLHEKTLRILRTSVSLYQFYDVTYLLVMSALS